MSLLTGQSDSTDGKNVIYDEMLEELCDADGSDRVRFIRSAYPTHAPVHVLTMHSRNPFVCSSNIGNRLFWCAHCTFKLLMYAPLLTLLCVSQKREYTYNRTCAVKNPDGTETHRTMRLRTPHNETHLMYVPMPIQRTHACACPVPAQLTVDLSFAVALIMAWRLPRTATRPTPSSR